jgi:hypothetical protein
MRDLKVKGVSVSVGVMRDSKVKLELESSDTLGGPE